MEPRLQHTNSAEERSPGVPVWRWLAAVKQSSLPSGAIDMAHYLANFINDCNVGAYPSIARLAAESRRCVRTVKARIKALEEAGLLKMERRRGADGRNVGNHYYPLFPETKTDPDVVVASPKLRLVKADQSRRVQDEPPGAEIAPGPGANSCISPGANSSTRTIHKRTTQEEPHSAQTEMRIGNLPSSSRKAAAQRKSSTATLLPGGEDFVLPEDWRQWTKLNFLTWDDAYIDKVAALFKGHWLAVPESKGRMRNWRMAWQNWCHRDYGPKKNGQPMNWGRHAWDQRATGNQATAQRLQLIAKLAGGAA